MRQADNSYPSNSQYAWASVGTLRVGFYDNLNYQYFAALYASAPTLTGATCGPGLHMNGVNTSSQPENNRQRHHRSSANVSSAEYFGLTGCSMSTLKRGKSARSRRINSAILAACLSTCELTQIKCYRQRVFGG